MAKDEFLERIKARRGGEAEPAKIGKHKVLIDRSEFPGGTVTGVHRLRKGRITQVIAVRGSYREDVAEALLNLTAEPGDRIQPVPLSVPGFALDRAVALPGDEEDTVRLVAVHHSEVVEGEKPKDFLLATSGNNGRAQPNDWSRTPVPRADARLVDDWPGGSMRKSKRFFPWAAEHLLSRTYVAQVPAGVHVEIRDVRGHTLLLTREWDRIKGTLTADGEARNVDLPRHELWLHLEPLFRGDDPATLTLEALAPPEPGLLEMRYETADRGYAQLANLETVTDCVAKIDKQIMRTPGNWAVLTSRSDAVVQVACADDGRLWLETPMPERNQSVGRHVSLDEAASILEILADEDRSAVLEMNDLEIEPW